jgi:NTE family protein
MQNPTHPSPRIALAMAGGGPLRSRQTNLAAKLGYHGISLNYGALDDEHRHQCAPKRPLVRVGRALTKLHHLMDNLRHVVQTAELQGKTTW